MDEITINEEQLLQESRKRIAADLAAAVKQSAKTGAWELEDVACEVTPDNILRKTMELYAGGNTPMWFLEAVQATNYILAIDRVAAYGCIVALHEAAMKAPAEKRVAALMKLLAVSCPMPGLFGGLAGVPALGG